MGNATIWWEGRGAEVVRAIDLGAPLADLQVIPLRDARGTETLGGHDSRTSLRARRRIRIESAPITDYTLFDEVEAMVEHIRRGSRISLAEDADLAWAGWAQVWSSPGLIVLDSAPWGAYGSGPAADHRIEVSGPSPRLLVERTKVSSIITVPGAPGGLVVLPERRHLWTDEGYTFVRNTAFWPVLRMPRDEIGAQATIHKHRRFWRLELTLDEDVAAIAALSTDPLQNLQGTTDLGRPTMMAQIRALGGL